MKAITILIILGGIIATIPTTNATHDPNDFFALETAFPGYVWNDVHGTSSTNIFAVGENAGASAIARRTGAGWAIMASVPNIGPLSDVWAVSTVAYAVNGPVPDVENSDAGRTYLKWDGAAWSSVTIPVAAGIVDNTDLKAVWAFSTTVVRFGASEPAAFGVQDVPSIVKFDGTSTYSKITCAEESVNHGRVFSIHGSSATDYYLTAVFNNQDSPTHVLHSDDTTCGPTNFFPNINQPAALYDIWKSSTNFLAVGEDTFGLGYISGPAASPTQNTLRSIWGLSLTDIWAVGDSGTIIHCSSGCTTTGWTLEPALATSENLYGVYFSDASNGWTVGRTGNIFKLQINANVAVPAITTAHIRAPEFQISVYGTHCLGDKIGFAVNLDLGVGITVTDMDVYIINAETATVIEQIDDGQMTNIANAGYYFQRTYPTAPYTALGVADLSGVGSVDYFDLEAFTVPAGSCFTSGDKQDIFERFTTLDTAILAMQLDVDFINVTTVNTETNLTDVHAHIDSHFVYGNSLENGTQQIIVDRTTYTNMRINDSFAAQLMVIDSGFLKTWQNQAYQNGLLNDTHAHLDAHFVYQNSRLNATNNLLTNAHEHIDAHFGYTNALMNESFANINTTIIVNANFTELRDLLNQTFVAQSVPIAESLDNGVYAWGVLLILIALIVWAEVTRETLIYVLAMLAGIVVIFALPAGFLAYRLIVMLTVALIGARAYFRETGT